MRVNLLLNDPGGVLNNYLNLDPYAPGNDARLFGTVGNLDDHVEDAEADEILANGVLDYLPPTDTDRVLNHWVSKLRHGGTLTLSGLDLGEVARRLYTGDLDEAAASLLLYGTQERPALARKVAVPVSVLCERLRSAGLTITRKYYEETLYWITAKRP